jgi:sugar phosphate isomerase/epimerase
MVKTSLFICTPDFLLADAGSLPAGKLEDSVELAKRFGYDGVEVVIGDPEIFDVEKFEKILLEKQMTVSAINSGGIEYIFQSSLVNADPKEEEDSFKKLQSIIRLCSRLKCLAQVGVSRGKAIPGKPITYFKSKLVAILKDLATYAEKLNVNLVLEYTNRFEINTINNFAEARDIVDRVGSQNLGILLDTYHSYLEDPDVYETVFNARDYVKHFHLHDSDQGPAGASNGVLDFEKFMRILKQINYSGYLSDGLLTTKLPEEQVLRSTSFLKDMIRVYGL